MSLFHVTCSISSFKRSSSNTWNYRLDFTEIDLNIYNILMREYFRIVCRKTHVPVQRMHELRTLVVFFLHCDFLSFYSKTDNQNFIFFFSLLFFTLVVYLLWFHVKKKILLKMNSLSRFKQYWIYNSIPIERQRQPKKHDFNLLHSGKALIGTCIAC